jgi:polyhydroxyalkanoate synthesis regulator phasin
MSMTSLFSHAGIMIQSVAHSTETQFPFLRNRRELVNQRILARLKKLGLASRTELKALKARIEHLEKEIELLKNATAR